MLKTALKMSLVLIAAFALGGLLSFTRAVSREVTVDGQAIVEVSEGEGPRKIAAKLLDTKLIIHERPFFIYVILTGRRDRFYPGRYELTGRQSIKTIVATMTDARHRQQTVRVVEGWRISDIAGEVAKKTKISQADFLAAAPVDQYEGYLFPDTYYVNDQTTAVELVKTMRANFDRRTADLSLTKEQVIIASIVEREAKSDSDRPLIAGLYFNRRRIGMALQADPTVQYAKGDWSPITVNDYRAVQSPYNTYLSNQLPPTPISNPGLASLKAAVQPAEHDYLYFLTGADGVARFAKTLDQHTANKRYLQP